MSKLERTTPRLFIRPLVSADYAVWKETHSTMRAPKSIWDPRNKPAAELTRAFFKKVLANQKKLRSEDRFYDLAVFEKRSGKLVGTVSVMDVHRGPGQSAYLGYAIFNRHWGQGFGGEAVRAIIDIAFRELGLHRLEAGIEPANRKSIKLAKALGLRKEGLKKRAVFLREQWLDLSIYAITSEEWGVPWKGRATPRLR